MDFPRYFLRFYDGFSKAFRVRTTACKVKALFRRGQARIGTGNTFEA